MGERNMSLNDREDAASALGDGPKSAKSKSAKNKSAKKTPANEIFSAAIAAGIAAYDRPRDLPRLLSVWPHEVEDCSDSARLNLLEQLRRALRAQKRRAGAGHWGYDLNRHLALYCAYRSELIALAESDTPPSCTAPKEAFAGRRSDCLDRGKR